MSRILILLITVLAVNMMISCGSKPDPVPHSEPAEEPKLEMELIQSKPVVKEIDSAPPADVFDPARITREYHTSTRAEVQQFIENLNQIIKSKNFRAWKAALSDEYFTEVSSPENLQVMSEQPALKTRRIVLKTAEDYFTHVVVPARANSRVDDIEFISMNRVKAFTITTNRAGEEVRLRLYDLEKIDDKWTIIN